MVRSTSRRCAAAWRSGPPARTNRNSRRARPSGMAGAITTSRAPTRHRPTVAARHCRRWSRPRSKAARPLSIAAMDIPIDHLGPYEVVLGEAALPNGVVDLGVVRVRRCVAARRQPPRRRRPAEPPLARARRQAVPELLRPRLAPRRRTGRGGPRLRRPRGSSRARSSPSGTSPSSEPAVRPPAHAPCSFGDQPIGLGRLASLDEHPTARRVCILAVMRRQRRFGERLGSHLRDAEAARMNI